MKRLPLILSIILSVCLLIPACEVENCPPNTLSYAHFTFVDQNGRGIQITDTVTVVGQAYADVENPSGQTVQDSLLSDTIINRETGVQSLQLPLSYADETRFIISYHTRQRAYAGSDTIRIKHKNIPYFTNLDCGTMMFYTVTEASFTHHQLDSMVITNPNIDNNEKENFKIYFTVSSVVE